MKIRSLFSLLVPLSSALLCLPVAHAQDEPKTPSKDEPAEPASEKVVTKDATVTIAGNDVQYTTSAATITLQKDDGTERAEVFYVSYIRKGVSDKAERPVMFAFNGGPGSSAVWLHLGALGPRLVQTTPDGTQAVPPPVTLVPNAHSILDVADLVFIDPVSTGYSRKSKDSKNSEFHGVKGDIASVSDFIRRWISENDRWHSPKFLLGESYGGIRAAGVANALQEDYGMSLNGVVLLSSLLDFRTLRPSEGDPITHQVFLPAMVAAAHHHGSVLGNRDELVQAAREFAFSDYSLALQQGSDIDPAFKAKVAARLSELTGIDVTLWLSSDLRLGSSRFRKELLREQNLVLGRFDARVAWPAEDAEGDYPSYDPSYSVVYGAFSTAMLDFLTRELGYEQTKPYEILTRSVHPWDWGKGNSFVNLTGDLRTALTHNPHLRVLVMCGKTDLATPPDNMLYSLRQGFLNAHARTRIETTWYEAGHMFYLNQPDLEKMRVDLVDFIER